jgi:pyrroloquinoline quinone biosynthesis protein B
MRVRVLGSAAGGAFPQWNCGCPNCRRVRAKASGLTPRSQASLAVSGDGEHYFLLNVSPDIRSQIEAAPELHPRHARGSPISGAVITNGDLDACLGALCLRESEPLALFTTEVIRRGLVEGNTFFRTLARFDDHVRWHTLKPHAPEPLLTPAGEDSGLRVEAIPIPGKVPLHLAGIEAEHPQQNIGVLLRSPDSQSVLGFFPSVAGPSGELERAIAQTTCCFFDGTFWTDDELPALGLATRSAREMAHWPLSGLDGSLAWLASKSHTRRVLIHINNTNPILDEASDAHQRVLAAGIEIGTDGLELTL